MVAFAIMNTLFMSLYERTFEFGVLRAVGTRPRRMATLVLLEAGALAVVSSVIGALVGLGVSLYFARHGIDYGGIEFAGVTFQRAVYPVIEGRQYVTLPLWLLGVTLLVATYPAIHAARITPAKAMRRSL